VNDQEQTLRQLLERLVVHQHAEKALREHRRMLVTLLSNLPGMAYRCRNDPDWPMEFVSEGCLELTGYRSADLIDSRHIAYGKIIHPADRKPVWRQVQDAVSRREPFQLSYRIITHAGEERWVSGQGRGVFNDDGQLAVLEGFIADITERRQTEELLRLSEACYRAIVEDQTDLVCRFLPNGTLTFTNEAYCHYFGHPYEEMLATSFIPMVPKEDWDYVMAQMAACNADHPINTYQHRVIRPDGTVRWVQWIDRAILDEDNALIELQSVGRDVTEQRLAEEALRHSEERYRRIVQTAQEGIWQIDAANCTTFVNARLAEMLGYTIEEMLGKSLFTFMDEAWRNTAMGDDGNGNGRFPERAEQHDLKFRRKDGSELWALISTNAILNDQGQYAGALAMVADITDRKRMEESLRRLATQDSLTGLFNRRYFFTVAKREFQRSQRYGHPLALLLLDIDYFKRINDSYGHRAGDQVLRTVAGVLREGLRQVDIPCRYGGEEFVILLPDTPLDTALAAAQRLGETLAETPIPTEKGPVPVTVSIGVAALFNGCCWSGRIRRCMRPSRPVETKCRSGPVMPHLPSLRVNVRPSRILLIGGGSGHVLAGVAVVVADIPLWLKIGWIIAIGLALAGFLQRYGDRERRGFIACIELLDGRWRLTTGDGQVQRGRLTGGYAHPQCLVDAAAGRCRSRCPASVTSLVADPAG